MEYTRKSAEISATHAYRYSLVREWDAELPRLLWVMLNPSTADAMQDDPTIRRCVGFAAGWDFGSIEVVNLYAYRTPSPATLLATAAYGGGIDIVGPMWYEHTFAALARAGEVVCAWGAHGTARGDLMLLRIYRAGHWPQHLGLTKGGQPKHPLYLPKTAALQKYSGIPL